MSNPNSPVPSEAEEGPVQQPIEVAHGPDEINLPDPNPPTDADLLRNAPVTYIAGPSTPAGEPHFRPWAIEDIEAGRPVPFSAVTGRVARIAQYYAGSLYLQNLVENGNQTEYNAMMSEIIPNAYSMATHSLANHVLQKALARASPDQVVALAWPLRDHLGSLIVHPRGHYFVLNALKLLPDETVEELVQQLSPVFHNIIGTPEGYGIKSLIELIEHFSMGRLGFLLDVVMNDAIDFACTPRGCQILEAIVQKGAAASHETWVLAHDLMYDEERIMRVACSVHGQRVLQAILWHGIPDQSNFVFENILPLFAAISCSGIGSLFAREFVRATPPDKQYKVTRAIVSAVPEFEYDNPIVMMADIPCANNVIECMLQSFEGDALYHVQYLINGLRDRIVRYHFGNALWARLQAQFALPPTPDAPEFPPPVNPGDLGPYAYAFVAPQTYPVRARGDRPVYDVEPDNPEVQPEVRVQMRNTIAFVEDPLLEWFNHMAIQPEASDYRISDFTGHLLALVLDRLGGIFVQGRLKPSTPDNPTLHEATAEEAAAVVTEVLPYFKTCCKSMYGTRLIQAVMEHGPEEVRAQFLDLLRQDVRGITRSEHGNFAISSVIEHCGPEIGHEFLDVLRYNVRSGLKNKNDSRVLKKGIEILGMRSVMFISHAVLEDLWALITHKYGTTVVQYILDCPDAEEEPMAVKQTIMEQIMANPVNMLQAVNNRYGNYCVQKVLIHGTDEMRNEIFARLRPIFEATAFNLSGRNVLHRLIEVITDEQQLTIVQDLADAPDGQGPFMWGEEAFTNRPIVRMACDLYAHTVVQRLCEYCRGDALDALAVLIGNNIADLRRTNEGAYFDDWYAGYEA